MVIGGPMSTFVKIPEQTILDLMAIHGQDVAPRVYVDKNPLVKKVFWKRLEVLLALSKTKKVDKVLDFGGGNGILIPSLSKKYKEVYCVDLKTEMGRDLCDRENIKNVVFKKGDILTQEMPNNSFDTIIAADVLEHIENPEDILERLFELLKNGGEILVSSPTENLFYRFSRLIFGYNKPHDHFHSAKYIDEKLNRKFRMTHRKYFPFYFSAVSGFSLVRLVKGSD